MFFGCQELLPPREDLSGLFTLSISSAFHRENGQNYVRIYVMVKNKTDETIQERADFQGTVEVTWVPDADVGFPGVDTKRTMHFDGRNLFRAPGFNAPTGILTLNPNDSIVFYLTWNMRSNDSTYLPKYWGSISDNECNVLYYNDEVGLRRISKRQHFSVSANLKLFDKLAMLFSDQIELSQCYVAAYRAETVPCTNINIVDPCKIVGE
jgi:hypothetical protein